MKKIISKLDKNSLLTGLITSLIILVAVFIYVIIKKPLAKNYLPALFVTQIGIAILWWVARMGGFSTLSSSTRRLGTSLRDRKVNKLGAYSDEEKKKKAKTPWEIEKESKKKSKQGIYIMLIIGLIELIVSLPFII